MLNHFLREVKDHQHHIASAARCSPGHISSKEIYHVNRQDLIHCAIIQDDARLADHERPAAPPQHRVPVQNTPAVDPIPAEENQTEQDTPARSAEAQGHFRQLGEIEAEAVHCAPHILQPEVVVEDVVDVGLVRAVEQQPWRGIDALSTELLLFGLKPGLRE